MAAFAATGVVSLLAGFIVIGTAGTAQAATGNLKVVNVGVTGEANNQPQVCVLKIEGFSFAPQQAGELYVEGQAPHAYPRTLVENVEADSAGDFVSKLITLPSGHYKAELMSGSEVLKSKTFWMKCDVETTLLSYTEPTVVDPDCDTAGSVTPAASQPTGVKEVINALSSNKWQYTWSLLDPTTTTWLDGSVANIAETYEALPALGYQSEDPKAGCYRGNITTVSYVAPTEVPATCTTAGALTPAASQPDGVTEVREQIGTNPVVWKYTWSLDKTKTTWTDGSTEDISKVYTVSAQLPSQSTNPNGACYIAPTNGGGGGSTSIAVTPEITYVDQCGTANDEVDGVAKTGYTFVVDKAKGSVTFTPASGYYLTTGPTLTAPLTDVPCPSKVTAIAPTVDQSEDCEVEGSYTIPSTTGVEYLLDGMPIQPGTYEGPVAGTVTAQALGDTVLTNPRFSFDLKVAAAGVCPVVAPVEEKDVCPNLTGSQTKVPKGYALEGGRCVQGTVQGVESQQPKPRPAAVPTAVDAGFGPAPVVSQGSLLGQGLVGGGLLMLLLAGSMQMGRRERGAHEI